jgi:hypothetical protein
MENIDAFKAVIKGLTQTNRYRITINNEYLNNIPYQYMAKDVIFPGQSLVDSSIVIQGITRNLAGGMNFDPLSITFICDEKMSIRTAFENWHKKIYNKENSTLGYYDDYKTDIMIEILNKNFETIKKVLISDAWPKDFSDIQLSYDSIDQVMEFTVSFEHFTWKSID